MLVSLARQFESKFHHAVNATPRENRLLHRHLFFRAFVKAPADVRIFSFVVLTDDAEINLTGFPILQRSFNSFKKTHRPQIYVLPETSAYGDQQSPKRNVIRNAGMANGAEEDSVERPQLLQAVGGHHLSGLDVSFATPIEGVPVHLESKAPSRRFQREHAFGHHFFPDAVSGDDCDIESFHVRGTLSFSFFGCQQRRKRAHIRGRIYGADKSYYLLGLGPRPVRIFGASSELGRRFFKSHGVRGAALAKLGPARDDPSVLQMNFQQGGHLVETGALRLRVHIKVYTAIHLLNVGALNYFVRELAQAGFALQKEYGDAKFHAEFGFQSRLWLMVEKRGGHVVICADTDLFNLRGLQIVDFDQVRKLRHGGMSEGAGRIRLQRDSGGGEGPRLSETIHNCGWIVGSSEGVEEAPLRFQNLLRRSPAQGDKFR